MSSLPAKMEVRSQDGECVVVDVVDGVETADADSAPEVSINIVDIMKVRLTTKILLTRETAKEMASGIKAGIVQLSFVNWRKFERENVCLCLCVNR